MQLIDTLPTTTNNNISTKTRRRLGRFVSRQLQQIEHNPTNDDIDQIYAEIKAAQAIAVRALATRCH